MNLSIYTDGLGYISIEAKTKKKCLGNIIKSRVSICDASSVLDHECGQQLRELHLWLFCGQS